MFAITISEKGGETKRLDFDKPEITIGRVQGNDIILPKGNISKRHSRIVLKDGKFIIVDLKSTNGTYVNGRKITSPIVIKSTDKVYIGDFVITIENAAGAEEQQPPVVRPPSPIPPTPAPPDEAPPRKANPEQRTMGLPAVAEPPEVQPTPPPAKPAAPTQSASARDGDDPAPLPPPVAAPRVPEPAPPSESPRPEPLRPAASPAPIMPTPRPAAQSTVIGTPSIRAQAAGGASSLPSAPAATRPTAATPRQAPLPAEPSLPIGEPPAGTADRAASMEVLRQLVARLASRLNVDTLSREQLVDPALRQRGERLASDAAGEVATQTPAGVDAHALARDAIAELLGTGPIEGLFADPTVSEVSVPRHDCLFVVRGGKRVQSDKFFSSPEAVARVAARLQDGAPASGTRTRLSPTGLLVTMVSEPIAVRGPLLSIRRPRSHVPSLEELADDHALSVPMADFLEMAVRERRSVLVIGTASARADLVAALVQTADPRERVVLIEEREQSVATGSHVMRLNGKSGVRETLTAAWQLLADRLVVDEHAGLAVEALVASPGTIATCTGLSAVDGVARLYAQARLSGIVDGEFLREALVEHVDVLVHVNRGADGKARVTRIAELQRIDDRGQATVVDVYSYKADGAGGSFVATGHVPDFAEARPPSTFKKN